MALANYLQQNIPREVARHPGTFANSHLLYPLASAPDGPITVSAAVLPASRLPTTASSRLLSDPLPLISNQPARGPFAASAAAWSNPPTPQVGALAASVASWSTRANPRLAPVQRPRQRTPVVDRTVPE